MKFYLTTAIIIFSVFPVHAQSDLAGAASRFLNSLDKNQRAKIQLSLTVNERFNWNYVPLDKRAGLPLNELTDPQKELGFALLKECLSAEGYRKTTEITQLEIILKEIEHRAPEDRHRDPGKYFFAIFGDPSATAPWCWRFEGHHVSFTFSSVNNRLISGTPGFLGANPAIVPDGPLKGKEVLQAETDRAFELLNSLNREQRKKAIFSINAPPEIITGNLRNAVVDESQGIAYVQLSRDQQHLLLELVEIYVARYTKLFLDEMLRDMHKAGLEKLRFAWAGDTKKGSGGYYYRISGPTLVIEFDNTQNNANHVHTVVRDLQHDFGGDLLLEHYQAEHSRN